MKILLFLVGLFENNITVYIQFSVFDTLKLKLHKENLMFKKILGLALLICLLGNVLS